MKKKLTKGDLRAYTDDLYSQALADCMIAHELSYHNGQQYAAMKERADTKKRIANELYALLDKDL